MKTPFTAYNRRHTLAVCLPKFGPAGFRVSKTLYQMPGVLNLKGMELWDY